VESGVVVVHSAEEFTDVYIDSEFFFQFASERLLRSFARFHLAAGKFPTVLEFTIASLSCENFVIVFDNACYYFDVFHNY
jgi:hypothetical protein